MLATAEITLKKLGTGESSIFVLHRMTLRDKCSLDEWIRRRYVADALKETELNSKDSLNRKVIFAAANEMDFLSNSWAVADQLWLARFIWQCITWKQETIGFESFFNQYFNQELGESVQSVEYQSNWLALKESRGFITGENPTVARTETEKENRSGNESNS